MKSINTDELNQKLDAGDELHIIDVREKDEVATGMIPGARHIPLGELPERTGNWNLQNNIMWYARQAAAARKLQNTWSRMDSIQSMSMAACRHGAASQFTDEKKPIGNCRSAFMLW